MQQQLEIDDKVYIKDDDHEWLPARVIETTNDDCILVEIELPIDWPKTTITAGRCPSSMSNHGRHEAPPPKQHGERRWIKLDEYKDRVLPLQNVNTATPTKDIAELQHLHEAAVLYQIKNRHLSKRPYTRVGDILIAVNPCQWIDQLYTAEQRHLYAKTFVWMQQNEVPDTEVSEEKKESDRSLHRLSSSIASSLSLCASSFTSIYDRLGFEPHIYEVSALAYRGLFLNGKNQTILVSGESGAGKTETVKIVLKHLAGLETTALMMDPSGDVKGTTSSVNSNVLVSRIVESSSIFEAFGNAKTLRNHNSSRFGKMTRLYFGSQDNGMCGLRGSTCKTYLLETSRVVQQSTGERNFHIFYQLLSAPSDVKRHFLGHEKWERAQPADFRYLSEPNHDRTTIGKASDDEKWQETLRALEFFQFNKADKLETLLRALGIVLLLGNIVFEELPSGDGGCFVSTLEELILVADAMGISVDVVEKAMTRQVIKTRMDRVEVPLNAEVAKGSLDALVKKIYACVFESVVFVINKQTQMDENVPAQTDRIVSLLDIYGFESFQVNRFEQLCINYANERLHKKYVDDNFCRVQVEYDEQGIQVFDFQIVDNSGVLDIFEGQSGLIGGLDEECIRRDGCSKEFVRKVRAKHAEHDRFIDDKINFHNTEFGVSHFAGPVVYDATGFVERNTDKLPYELMSMAVNTSNKLIHDAFDELLKQDKKRQKSDIGRKSSTGRTVLQKFRIELKELMVSIGETQTRYIRCIKPNEKLSARVVDHQTVVRQLKCAGIVAAIDLSRESFPTKLSFQAAEDRFKCLLKDHQVADMEQMDDTDRTRYMMSLLFAPLLEVYKNCDFTLPYACGKTAVYFRAGALELLEDVRHEYYSYWALKIQQWTNKTRDRRDFLRFRKAVVLLQAQLRMRCACCYFRQQRRAAVLVQAVYRGYLPKSDYGVMINGFSKLQRLWCLAAEGKQHRIRHKSVVQLQAQARCQIARIRYARMLLGFSRLQAKCLATKDKKRLNLMRQSVPTIQSICLAHVIRSRFLRAQKGMILLQAQCRGANEREYQAQSRFEGIRLAQGTLNLAATKIQAVLRTSMARAQYDSAKEGAILFQARYRGIQERSRVAPRVSSVHENTPSGVSVQPTAFAPSSTGDPAERVSLDLVDGRSNDSVCDSQYDLDKNSGKLVVEAQSKVLKHELDQRQQEVENLHEDIALITQEAEVHKQEIEAEYEERLAAYEEEVMQLKQTIQEDSLEKRYLKIELEQIQERHEEKVKRMLRESYHQAEESKKHLLQVAEQIEKAKEDRARETSDILFQIDKLKSEKNEKILHLEAQLARVRSTMTMSPPSLTVTSPTSRTDDSEWSSSIEHYQHANRILSPTSDGLGDTSGGSEGGDYLHQVEKLRRDLLTISATHNLVELVNKANARPWQKDVHIERVCRSIEIRVTRLAELAVQSHIKNLSEEPTVKHMHVSNESPTTPTPQHVAVDANQSPTSTLGEESCGSS